MYRESEFSEETSNSDRWVCNSPLMFRMLGVRLFSGDRSMGAKVKASGIFFAPFHSN